MSLPGLPVVVLDRAFAPVRLGAAGGFAILSKAGISTVPSSAITGNIGVSPIAATAMTGFSLIADASNLYSTSAQVTGQAFAASYGSMTPAMLTTAVLDMEAAYTDASSRPFSGRANLNANAGLIGGMTLTPVVYQWGSDVKFDTDITIMGNKDSTYIFQSTGNVVAGAGVNVILKDDGRGNGSPNPANIVWVVAGYLDVGTTAHLEGVLLVKTKAIFKTGSSLNGRILAQTSCTLDQATIVSPTDAISIP